MWEHGDMPPEDCAELARYWAESLAEWAIPDEILAKAPEPPWGLPPGLFTPPPEPADTPSRRVALAPLQAKPGGGSVLDIGAGGGAASFALVPPATRLTAVDQSPAMLRSFAERAAERGVEAVTVEGSWPDVAVSVDPADVVVCHNVLYNVADPVPFLTALTEHAELRVVIQITANHPRARLSPLWSRFWGITMPQRPRATDALDLVRAMGLPAESQSFTTARPPVENRSELVAFVRRQLCVGPERDGEIERWISENGFGERQAVCIWWDTGRIQRSRYELDDVPAVIQPDLPDDDQAPAVA